VAAGGVVALVGFAAGNSGAEALSSGSFSLSSGHFKTAVASQQFVDGVGSATFSIAGQPTGGGLYVGIDARSQSGRLAYRGKLRVLSDGSLRVGISKVIPSGEESAGSVAIPGSVSAGQSVNVEVSVTRTDDPVISVRAWPAGTAKPRWQYTVTDTRDSAIISAGQVRAWAYLSALAVNPVTVGFENLVGRPADKSPLPTPSATLPTTAASTSTRPTSTPTPTQAKTTQPASPSASNPAKPTASASSAPVPDPGNSSPPEDTDHPSAQTTGVPAGTKLTVHQGDITITKAGTVLDALDIRGFVEIRAPRVTIKRSIIRGGVTKGLKGVVQNNDSSATDFVLQDSEIRPSNPSVWLTGVKGANFTMRRVHVNGGVVDGVMVSGNNVRVEGSYIHGLDYYTDDPTHSDGSHNDGVQVVGGANVTITGNTIEVAKGLNSALQVTQDVDATRNLSFTKNRVDGGTCSVKLNQKGRSTLGPVTVSNNLFGRAMSIPGCAILRTNATSLVASGNAWDDNHQPVAAKVYD
jgi:hypothetical protein